jgi:hypothetical protein
MGSTGPAACAPSSASTAAIDIFDGRVDHLVTLWTG